MNKKHNTNLFTASVYYFVDLNKLQLWSYQINKEISKILANSQVIKYPEKQSVYLLRTTVQDIIIIFT